MVRVPRDVYGNREKMYAEDVAFGTGTGSRTNPVTKAASTVNEINIGDIPLNAALTKDTGYTTTAELLDELFTQNNGLVKITDRVDFQTNEPASPATKSYYIHTGAGDVQMQTSPVTVKQNRIYRYTGSTWLEIAPAEGYLCWVTDEDLIYLWDGSSWLPFIDIGGVTDGADQMIYTTAADVFTKATITAYGRSLLAIADEAALKALVNLEIGTDVQGWDAKLDTLAGIPAAGANKVPVTNGANSYETTDLTNFAKTIIASASAAAVRALLTLDTGDTPTFANVSNTNAPSQDDHLVRKDYVDSVAQGISWQDPVADQVDFTSAEPGSPTTGQRYINTTTGTSSATAQSVTAGRIYEWDGATWEEYTPAEGWSVWDESENTNYTYNGSNWVKFSSTVSHNNIGSPQGGTLSEYYHLTAAQHADLMSLTSAEIQQLANIGSHTISETTWGNLVNMQDIATSTTPNFAGLQISGASIFARANQWTKTQNVKATTIVSSGGTLTWDLSSNQVTSVTLTENVSTLTLQNLVDGAIYILVIQQGGPGLYTITWPATVKWPGGTAPTLSTVVDGIDVVTFVAYGTDLLAVGELKYNQPTVSPIYFYPYQIDQSLRFDGASHLTYTPLAGNSNKWTFSCWFKRSQLGVNQVLFSADGATGDDRIWIDNNDQINVFIRGGIDGDSRVKYKCQDTTNWYHLVVVWDDASDVASDRLIIYVNGWRVTEWQYNQAIAPNVGCEGFGKNVAHYLGKFTDASNYFDGYLAEVHYCNGLVKSASDFGQFVDGVWCPKAYSGPYGTNGFYLTFQDNSSQPSLGTDYSGNINHFTVSGAATIDQVLDSPTNNFCTMSPDTPYSSSATLSEGSLKMSGSINIRHYGTMPTPKDTKIYFEVLGAGSHQVSAGISEPVDSPLNIGLASDQLGFGLRSDNLPQTQCQANGTTLFNDGGNPWVNNTAQFAYDPITGSIWAGVDNGWYDSSGNRDGTTYSNPATGTNPTFNINTNLGIEADTSASERSVFPAGILQSTSRTLDFNFGQGGQTGLTYYPDANGQFKYPPPDGFKALCFKSVMDANIRERWAGYDSEQHYMINHSCMFDSASSSNLEQTSIPSNGNNNKYTISLWFKRSNILTTGTTNQCLISAGDGTTKDWLLLQDPSVSYNNVIRFYNGNGATGQADLHTDEKFIDTSRWHHLVFVYDDTHSLVGERCRFYLNGIRMTSITSINGASAPTQNIGGTGFGAAKKIYIGSDPGGNSHFNGYLADVWYNNGVANSPEMYGKMVDGEWIPIEYAGTHGSIDFHLDFSNSSDLGADASVNNNNFNPTGLGADHQCTDTPTNNFYTLVTKDGSSVMSEGNLKWVEADSQAAGRTNPIPAYGKWYCEFYVSAIPGGGAIEITFDEMDSFNNPTDEARVGYTNIGEIRPHFGAWQLGYDSYTTGDWIGVAIDMDIGEVTWYKNNIAQSLKSSFFSPGESVNRHMVKIGVTTSTGISYWINFGQNPGGNFGTNTDENGYGQFKYSPPSGYLALCDANIESVEYPSDTFTYDYEISNSIYLNGSNQYFSRIPVSNGDRQKLTISCWLKVCDDYNRKVIVCAGDGGGTNDCLVRFDLNNRLYLRFDYNVPHWDLWPKGMCRDTASWMHFMVAIDTTQSIPENTVKLYINGKRSTDFDSPVYGSQNEYLRFTESGQMHYIGREGGGNYFEGYLADFILVDGQQLEPTDLGYWNHGVWCPKNPVGLTFGTQGFWLDFADQTALQKDVSGNGNDWTPNNFTNANQVEDTPTNNFCTFNPLDHHPLDPDIYAEGNTKFTTGNYRGITRGTFGFKSGKWYWEYKILDLSGDGEVGIIESTADLEQPNIVYGWGYYAFNGNKVEGNRTTESTHPYGTSSTVNDYIMVAVDADSGTVWYGKNGIWQNDANQNEIESGDTSNCAWTGLDMSMHFLPMVRDWNDAGSSSFQANFGQNPEALSSTYADSNGYGQFKYEPPTEFLALCSKNLPDPPTGIWQGNRHFDTGLTDGNGVANRVLGNLHFQPSALIGKWRTGLGSHTFYDRIRSGQYYLFTDTNTAEGSGGNVYAFNKRSITTGTAEQFNYSGRDSVQWYWRADEHVAGMTKGAGISKPYSGLVNRRAGFSIIGYEGNGTSGHEIPHHLSQTPELRIFKQRTAGATIPWLVSHKDLTDYSYYLKLDQDSMEAVAGDIWNSTPPSPTTSQLGTSSSVNTNDASCLMLSFHSVDGYCKVGSYIGNGNADGTFVFLGFRPAFFLVKNINTGGHWWHMFDSKRNPYNPADLTLYPNATSAETTATYFDFLSNGVKIITSNNGVNLNGDTYIYIAFAEHPFKIANAR